MTSVDTEDQAIRWAIQTQQDIRSEVARLDQNRQNGLFVDEEHFQKLQEMTLLSLEDLKRERLRQIGLGNTTDESLGEFIDIVTEVGGYSSDKTLLSKFIKSRKEEYLNHYKLDPKDPGMMFVVSQLVQDELQINKLRQDLAVVKSSRLVDVEKDEQSKRIMDLLVKLNKSIFEFTKYLKNEKAETELKETEKQEKANKEEKRGLAFKDLMVQLASDPRFEKAKSVQQKKRTEYVEQNLGDPT